MDKKVNAVAPEEQVQEQPEDKNFKCPNCNKSIKSSMNFCPYCQQKLKESNYNPFKINRS